MSVAVACSDGKAATECVYMFCDAGCYRAADDECVGNLWANGVWALFVSYYGAMYCGEADEDRDVCEASE